MADISSGNSKELGKAERAARKTLGLQFDIESPDFTVPEAEVLRMLLLADGTRSGYDLLKEVERAPNRYRIRPRYNTTIEALNSLKSRGLVKLEPSAKELERHRGLTRLHRNPYTLTLAGFVVALEQNPKLWKGTALDGVISAHKDLLPELFEDWGAVLPEDMDTERVALIHTIIDAASGLRWEVSKFAKGRGDPSLVHDLELGSRISLHDFLIRGFIGRRGTQSDKAPLAALPPFMRNAEALSLGRRALDGMIGETEKRLSYLKSLRSKLKEGATSPHEAPR